MDVMDDLKRLNEELRQENDALAEDRERVILLEDRCQQLQAMLEELAQKGH